MIKVTIKFVLKTILNFNFDFLKINILKLYFHSEDFKPGFNSY